MRRSTSVAHASPSGSSPSIRRSEAVAPFSRAASIVGASVRFQPSATAATTIGRLKTPNAAATRCPDTWSPRHAPRLAK